VIQELIAERTAFREAMQQTMEDVSPMNAAKKASGKLPLAQLQNALQLTRKKK
jgi:hypothetical protein